MNKTQTSNGHGLVPNEPRVLATICARGGSKGVPGKNLRTLRGKPLLAYAIDCARACAAVSHLVVSTEDERLAAIAEACGVLVPFRRPTEMATDAAAKVYAIRHATRYVEEHDDFHPDIVVDLDVGVPLRAPEDVAACIGVLTADPSLDAAVTVYEAERNPYFNMVERDGDVVRLVCRPGQPVVRRQDAPAVFSCTPSVFGFRRASLDTVTHLYEGRWGACIVPRERAIDIDSELDLRLVELLMSTTTP